MSSTSGSVEPQLTGRIRVSPSDLLHEIVLQPQFVYELEHLLPYYIQIEEATVAEYARLGLMSQEDASEVAHLLSQIDEQSITADPKANMSDICFAIEQYVDSRLTRHLPAWHVDRSRNDVQATAQVMFSRAQLLSIIELILTFSERVQSLAEQTVAIPMPGYTHYQSAQILTVGFYLAAVNEQMGKTLHRLQNLYEEVNECPLGAGAMAGLELPWDRNELAKQLGFDRPCRHALVGVASKEWMLHIGAECSTFAVTVSRFVTDLITWGSSEYGFIDLPDQLSGISSAMPQKKNFPILERIRGKAAHLTAYYMDFVMAQRNTPYTNLVETSKEGGTNFYEMVSNLNNLLKLFTSVMDHIQFKEQRMYEICTREFFGGFSLANVLSLQKGIRYRQAQVIAGRYIVGMLERKRTPDAADPTLLRDICLEYDYDVWVDESELRQLFSVEHSLTSKSTLGSANPNRVVELLRLQQSERQAHRENWSKKVIQAIPPPEGTML